MKQVLDNIKAGLSHTYAYNFVLVVVLAFSLMAALSSYFLSDIVRKQLESSAKAELTSLETAIMADLKEPKAILGNQSEIILNMILRGRNKEEVQTYMNEITVYIQRHEDTQLMGFAGLFGSFDVFGGVILDGQNRPAPEGYVPGESDWYTDAVAAGGEVAFMQPHFGLLYPELVITYTRALFDNNGNLFGVVAMDINFSRVKEYIVNSDKDKLWFGVLLDEDYKFIFHRDSRYEGTKFEDVSSDTAKLAAMLKSGENEIDAFRMVNYQNVESITFMRKLENGWYLGIVIPENAYFSGLRRMRVILILLGAVLSVIFSVITVSIIRQKQKADADKQRADAMLKEANNLIENIRIMQKILDSLDAIIYITNPQTGEIIFINNNAKNYYNVADDCIGELCYETFHDGQNSRCSFCPHYELEKDPDKVIEWIEHSAVTGRHYRNTVCHITWLGGSTVQLRYSIDITELHNAKEQAETANQVKSDFLARMSHEIRSPLNAILGITEMQLEKEGLPPDTVEALDKVNNSGHMLLNIINDILDLSKIESGRMELSPTNYEVASVINDTVHLNMVRFESKPIKFALKVDENVPAKLFGDDLRIKQILNNILSNAFKYTDTGRVDMAVSADADGKDGVVTLILRVSDTGRGMTQDQIDKVFEDYARFNVEANRQIEGTGLGMSITKRFIEMMKGEITVESELGKGTTFTIRIPQGYVDSTVLGREGAANLQQLHIDRKAGNKRASVVREYMPYGRILVVDDMEPNLYVAKGLLGPYGLSIDTSSNGPEAIEKIKSGQTFDIIFMDHYMPEMDGIEATKIIRGLGYKNPIVALTANALVGQVKIFLENGFDGFVSKPIDTRQLNSVLNKFIRDKYPAETVEAARQLKSIINKKSNQELPDLSNLRALVVDDFLPNLNVAAGILHKFKIQADCVSNGKEAVERIKSGEPKYDIVFMDLMMPDMDGVEATRWIRALGTEYADKIPVIALSAIITDDPAEKEEKEKSLVENGLQMIIYKPLTVAKMEDFIKNWLHDNLFQGGTAVEKEENVKINIPGVDEGKIKEMYDGDFDIFLPVLRSYLSVIPEALEKMSHVTGETLPQYTVTVHGVKSTSDSIGAEQARKMALELEMAAKAGDFPLVQAKNGALIQYVTELLTNIQKWLAKLDAK
jgi:signal transduction histidine kinase/DNA-binding response OmpR family regulator/HPt (histidine-containing phosphotransfer) domain-containing protein